MTDTISINGFTYSADMATVVSVDKDVFSLNGMERGVRYIGKWAFSGCENLRIVHIPETVIRIEDFAFRDCPNIQELHLPQDMEYISPLAFTFSEGKSNSFYNTGFKVFIPQNAYLKYVFMIPQYISYWDHDSYGLTEEDMESIDGWDEHNGLPIYVDENELCRMVIADTFSNEQVAGKSEESDKDIDTTTVEILCKKAFREVFGDSIKEEELFPIGNGSRWNDLDERLSELMKDLTCNWLTCSWNSRPYEFISNDLLIHSLWTGYMDRTEHDWDVVSCFRMNTKELMDCFFKEYLSEGYPLTVHTLRSIVRQFMRMLYCFGFNYGLKPTITEPYLFSEEEMRGHVDEIFFDRCEESYLEFIRMVSQLDDGEFRELIQEYRQHESETGSLYYLSSFPGRVLSYTEFHLFGEILNLRLSYVYRFPSSEERITVPHSFKQAWERFLKECADERYVQTNWITSYHPQALWK